MKIAVYCGSNKGSRIEFEQAAVQIGKWLAMHGHTLIYGGGKAGLMGVVADAVLQADGTAIGVIPRFLQAKELAHPTLTQLYVVETMTERKNRMSQLADAFIALPGGPGTLEEITEMISWARIGQNPHPCIFFNVANYYAPLKQFYDEMVTADFLTKRDRAKICFANSITEIADFIQAYPAVAND